MGGASSTANYANLTKDQIVTLMMPAYYTQNAVITDEVIRTAKNAWVKIIEDRIEIIREANKDPHATATSGMVLFYTTFFDRLFDVHPLAKPLFKGGMQAQGKSIVKMVSMIINTFKNREKFESMVKDVAHAHCRMGVKAGEFAVVGDVLFYSLKKCLGDEYTLDVEDAWKKIYSAMLELIVPFCLNYESDGGHEKDCDTAKEVRVLRAKLDPSGTQTSLDSVRSMSSTA